MAGPLTGLTTRGRCLLAAGAATALCAVVLDERDLLRAGFFVAVLPLLSLALAAATRLSIKATRAVFPDRVVVGSPVDVSLEIRNEGRLPVSGLLLEDQVPDAAGAPGGSTPRYLLGRLGRGHAATASYRLQPVLRGVHRLGPMTVRITDPFGFAEFERELAGDSQLVVTPVVVGLLGAPAGVGGAEGPTGAGRLRRGPGENDAVVRAYRHGDDLRSVHWRSTARRDELMVRVQERPRSGGVSVLLDRRAAAHRGHGSASSLEWAVSLTASICLHLLVRGEPLSLLTEDGAAPVATNRADAVLAGLAALRPSSGRSLSGQRVRPSTGGGGLIAILGRVSEADVDALLGRWRGGDGHAVLLDVAGWEPGRAAPPAGGPPVGEETDRARRTLAAAGWSVTVARAGSKPSAAWDRLVSTSRTARATR